jgi:hypothetical protein
MARQWTSEVCGACGLTLDRWLVEQGRTRHVSCEGKPYRGDLQPRPTGTSRRRP